MKVAAHRQLFHSGVGAVASGCDYGDAARSVWRDSLDIVGQYVAFGRRVVRAGDHVYHYGDPFTTLYVVNAGLLKVMSLTTDGREQTSALSYKGDWLGYDGIPSGHHVCSAMVLDTGELWTLGYDALLSVSAREPKLLRLVLAAMSEQMARSREVTISIGTLSADARVADFLLHWAQRMTERGMRTDHINTHMSRAEIGSYLGIRLESVSRALCRLANLGLVQFSEQGRREIGVPSVAALGEFVLNNTEPETSTLQ